MGFRFRKSINLGKGFRINMSKTGPGFSWGGKGFRITRTAGGKIRGSAYIPGTGLSYQKEFSNPLDSVFKGEKKSSPKTTGPREDFSTKSYDLDFKNIKSDALEEVLTKTGKTYPLRMPGLLVFIAGIILTFIQPYLVIVAIIGAIMYFYKKGTDEIKVDYDFEGDAKDEYDLTNKLLEGILESDAVWLVREMERDNDDNIIISRESLAIKNDIEGPLDTNVKVKSLAAKNFTMSFLPDCLLLYQDGDYRALSYENLKIDLRAETFLEEEKIPDATLISKSFLHVNKDGTPDKRYKDNPELYLVDYGILEIKADDLELLIVFSDTVIDGK